MTLKNRKRRYDSISTSQYANLLANQVKSRTLVCNVTSYHFLNIKKIHESTRCIEGIAATFIKNEKTVSSTQITALGMLN